MSKEYEKVCCTCRYYEDNIFIGCCTCNNWCVGHEKRFHDCCMFWKPDFETIRKYSVRVRFEEGEKRG